LIEVLLEALALKDLDRAGWLRVGVDRPESVAAHSWGVAWLVMVLVPPELDRGKALAYAILHDLPEVRIGDLTPNDGVPREEKYRRESRALAELLGPLPESEALCALWHDYESQEDPESRFVRQLDRLDMALQAIRYARADVDIAGFLDSAATVIEHPKLRELLAALRLRLP
jgi:putative hydrolases of HD superfamily